MSGLIFFMLGLAVALPALAVAYLLVLTAAAWRNPKRALIDGVYRGERLPGARFIILIPAHNEELLLGTVLEKLRRQSYPASHFEIVVIADNCEDATAAIATEAGARVFERHDLANRGKGQALNWLMTGHLRSWKQPYDAVVILDADSVVNPDFLWFMNESLAEGHEAQQGYYGVQNPRESWRTSLLVAALAAFHFLRPLGRQWLGLSCGLKGNGMCFSRRLVETYGYPAFSVVEDVELAMFYLQKGILVNFVSGAHVLGQMAVSAREAHSQRARWEGGRLELIRTWCRPLLAEGCRERNAAKIDGALDLLMPPLSILAGLTLAVGGVMALVFWRLPSPATLSGLVVALLSLAGLVAYVFGGLVLVKAPPVVYLRLLCAPFYITWKLWVYVKMFWSSRTRKKQEWVRTERHDMHGD
jgi:GT2 family glycosyltransferase